MSDPIRLVARDNRPYVRLTLTSTAGVPIDLSDAGTTVTVKFRSVDNESQIATLSTSKVNGGATGEVMFNFPNDALDVPAGYYEGEVFIDFTGEVQTVFDKLKFLVREPIPDVIP